MSLSRPEQLAREREAATPETILQELEQLADSNPSFRRNKLGRWTVSLSTSESAPEFTYFLTRDIDSPPLIVSRDYIFTAEREYLEQGIEVKSYTYTVTDSLQNTQFPELAARYAYGAYKDPLKRAQPVTFVRSADITINDGERLLEVTQRIGYFDKEGDQILSVSTDLDQESDIATVYPVFDSFDNQDEAVDDDYFNQPIPLQFRADARIYHEADDENILSPEHFAWLQREIDSNHEKHDLDMAFYTLRSMQQALRTQLGMQI